MTRVSDKAMKTRSDRGLQRKFNLTAAGGWVAIAGSVVHLVLTPISRAEVWADIVAAGWWNTITLRPSADQLRFAEAFWITPGSFAVPLFVLGILAVLSARKGHRLPAALGWILAIWGILCASLLPVSGAWLFILVGVLFVVGDRVRVLRH
ncbi:DUF6463 family protein [Arthrobacter cavernae]|uniref:Uncharacterized protein n=1 Tax=Arthrobacter cavernae TaxID=2817681 RepID=A0A939KJ98_9MICC|nr:DUF6463 family protein [Arthrobacter cavernae]MBO1267494.1 hypothetical protein [Arthrobacter cavernae]